MSLLLMPFGRCFSASKTARAAAWLASSHLVSQLLRLCSNLILTRLLVPEAFGLVAAVNVLYFALVMFSDLGVWQSVVRSPRGQDPVFLGTAWSVQLLRGLLLAVIIGLLVAALSLANNQGWFATGTVYADPRLAPMLAVFALCALVQGAESIKLATAERELQGGRLARLELACQLGTLLITVGLAWLTRSAWALLAGMFFGGLLRTVLSHCWLPGKNIRPAWECSALSEIVGFGKWIFLSSIIGFFAGHGEKIILAATLSTAAYGVFSIAGTLLAAIAGLYSTVNGRVIFPRLSMALREGTASDLAAVYCPVQRVADLCLGLLSGGLLTAGHWLVWVLYDARYQAAGWMLQCLSLSLLAMRHQVVEQLMFARNRPAWVTANNLLRALVLVIAIPLGFAWDGERGAILGVVVSQFASWPLSLYFKYQEKLLTTASERWWIPALLSGGLLGAGVDLLMSAGFGPR